MWSALVMGMALVLQDPKPETSPRAQKLDADAAVQSFYLSERESIDRAVESGLDWLASQQLSSGAWPGFVGHKMQDDYVELARSLPLSAQKRSGHGHPGVTALCGMAFLAGGHLPGRGKYGKVVENALEYITTCVQKDGLVQDSGTRMYSHAFAVLFLAEIHGMAGPKGRSREALEKSVNLIVDAQNKYGAWRYNTFDEAADLSVTVCQLQALRAARNIGIEVPKGTVDRALQYVIDSRTPRGRNAGLFYYKIYGRGARRKNTEYAINAAAITALHSAGIYDENLSAPALRFLDRTYGDIADYYPTHFYFWYGNYYACQAFFQAGGTRWRIWYPRIAKDLVRMQESDGRWRNRVGPGDEFGTAVACLILQVPKQLLPIFQR